MTNANDPQWPFAGDVAETRNPYEVFSPFKTIWTAPRETIRQIVQTDPELHVNLLLALAGIASSLDRASGRNAGDKISFGMILVLVLIIGPIGGIISGWVYAHLLRIAGNWLSGHARHEELKAAIGWSSVPNVVGLVFWIPVLLIFGIDMFTEEMSSVDGSFAKAMILLAFTLALIVLALWSLILLCNTVAEVQGFRSAWKGLANLILGGLVFFVPMMLIIFGILAVTRLS